jgi:hypothetical protein
VLRAGFFSPIFGKEPHQGLETKAVKEKVSVEITAPDAVAFTNWRAHAPGG